MHLNNSLHSLWFRQTRYSNITFIDIVYLIFRRRNEYTIDTRGESDPIKFIKDSTLITEDGPAGNPVFIISTGNTRYFWSSDPRETFFLRAVSLSATFVSVRLWKTNGKSWRSAWSVDANRLRRPGVSQKLAKKSRQRGSTGEGTRTMRNSDAKGRERQATMHYLNFKSVSECWLNSTSS